MEIGGSSLNPMDPRSARRLRSAQRIINQREPSEISNPDQDSSNTDGSSDVSQITETQNKLLQQLKNLSDAVYQISSTQTNVASIRIEQVSEVYYTRQLKPILDGLYFISISSLNMAGVAQSLQGNTFGDRKELRESLELVYRMNHELDGVLDALARRMKIYLLRIKEMDKNCPPFVKYKEGSKI